MLLLAFLGEDIPEVEGYEVLAIGVGDEIV